MSRPGIVAILVVLGLCLSVAASDSLRTADSLRDAQTELPLWSDSGLVKQDSLTGGRNAVDRWLLPLGIVVLTGASVWLLFSVRSK